MEHNDGPQVMVMGLVALASVAFILAVFFCCLQRCQSLFCDYKRLSVIDSEEQFFATAESTEIAQDEMVHFEVIKPTLIYRTKRDKGNNNKSNGFISCSNNLNDVEGQVILPDDSESSGNLVENWKIWKSWGTQVQNIAIPYSSQPETQL